MTLLASIQIITQTASEAVATIADWAMVAIACAALFVSFYSAFWTRKYNLRSMHPYLTKVRNTVYSDTGITLTMGIENTGVGAAIIKNMSFSLNGKKFLGSGDYSKRPAELVRKCIPSKWTYKIVEHGTFAENSGLLSGRQKVIVSIFIPYQQGDKKYTSEELEKETTNFPDRADYTVVYTSIYGGKELLLTTIDKD